MALEFQVDQARHGKTPINPEITDRIISLVEAVNKKGYRLIIQEPGERRFEEETVTAQEKPLMDHAMYHTAIRKIIVKKCELLFFADHNLLHMNSDRASKLQQKSRDLEKCIIKIILAQSQGILQRGWNFLKNRKLRSLSNRADLLCTQTKGLELRLLERLWKKVLAMDKIEEREIDQEWTVLEGEFEKLNADASSFIIIRAKPTVQLHGPDILHER